MGNKELYKAIEGQKVIIEPNSPSEGLVVAFIEDSGVPVEFMQFEKMSTQHIPQSFTTKIL